jgi:hypothetical protein
MGFILNILKGVLRMRTLESMDGGFHYVDEGVVTTKDVVEERMEGVKLTQIVGAKENVRIESSSSSPFSKEPSLPKP